jgi:hypothetical protein
MHPIRPPRRGALSYLHLPANYGEASALNFVGDRNGLPPAITGHSNYYLCGPGGCTGEVMITVGLSRGKVEWDRTDVESAATNTCR